MIRRAPIPPPRARSRPYSAQHTASIIDFDDEQLLAPAFEGDSWDRWRAVLRAASIATAVLADLAVIQDRLIGYFHVDADNPVTDIELGAAGLLCALAERLELAARSLRDC